MKRKIHAAFLIAGMTAAFFAVSAFADASQAVSEISTPGYIWQTASSIEAKKQFWRDMVFNYAGGQDDQWDYELISVTNLTGVSEYPGNGIKYIFYISNGNEYYMYENNDALLECHWEPDGYSGSDSLTRVGDNVAEKTEMINLSTYDGGTMTFELNGVSAFTGYDAAGNREICLAANLKNPILIKMMDEVVVVHSIQIFGEAVDQFCVNRDLNLNYENYDGYIVENSAGLQIQGELIEAHTAHHHTPVIMRVTDIY